MYSIAANFFHVMLILVAFYIHNYSIPTWLSDCGCCGGGDDGVVVVIVVVE